LLLQFALALQIFRGCIPLLRSFSTIGLHTLVVDELQGIAVVKVIVIVVVYDFAVHLSTAEYEVIEYLATDETDKGTAGKECLIAQTEFYAGMQSSSCCQWLSPSSKRWGVMPHILRSVYNIIILGETYLKTE